MKKLILIILAIITLGAFTGCSKDNYQACEYLKAGPGLFYNKEVSQLQEVQNIEDESEFKYLTLKEYYALYDYYIENPDQKEWKSSIVTIVITETPYVDLEAGKYEIRYTIGQWNGDIKNGKLETCKYKGKNKNYKQGIKEVLKKEYENYDVSGTLGEEYEYILEE
jgi:hypothetical protein